MHFLVIKKNSIIHTVAITVMLVLSIVFVAYSDAAAVYTGVKTAKKLPIYSVETEEKKVAITFDAAWGTERTDSILATLAEFDARATFFVAGLWARNYPEKLQKIYSQGIEIGTNGNTLAHFNKLSESQMGLELSAASAAIKDAVGAEPAIFRCPYGEYNDKVIGKSEELGYKVIQWDIDSLDRKGLSAGDVAARVLANVQNGSIILFHNDGENTPEALRIVLQQLKTRGYATETVSGLLYSDGYTIDSTGRQIKNNA